MCRPLDRDAVRRCTVGAIPFVPLWFAQQPERLIEPDMFEEAHKGDDVAGGVAAKAAEALRVGVDREASVLLGVEGAEAHKAPSTRGRCKLDAIPGDDVLDAADLLHAGCPRGDILAFRLLVRERTLSVPSPARWAADELHALWRSDGKVGCVRRGIVSGRG